MYYGVYIMIDDGVVIYIDNTRIITSYGKRVEIAVPAFFRAERDVYVEGCQLFPLDGGDGGLYLVMILHPRADFHPAVQVDGVRMYGLDSLADVGRIKPAG